MPSRLAQGPGSVWVTVNARLSLGADYEPVRSDRVFRALFLSHQGGGVVGTEPERKNGLCVPVLADGCFHNQKVPLVA